MGNVIISTLGDYLEHDHYLTAHCLACGHSRMINIPELAEKRGNDYAANRLRIRCRACGSRRCRLHVSPGVAIGMGLPSRTAP